MESVDSIIWRSQMNFGESLHVWRKRWKLTVALLVVASAGVAAAFTVAPRSYQSDSSLVLLASRSAAKQNGDNPYLSFSPSLNLTADALSRELMAPGTAQDLAAEGVIGSYTVALAPYTTTTTDSVLLVTVIGSNPARTEQALYAVMTEIGVKMSQLQNSVKPRNRIRARTLSFSPQATISIGQTARPLVAVVVLGLLFALGMPIVIDGQIARRRLIKRAELLPEAQPDQDVRPADSAVPSPAVARHRPPGYLPRSREGSQTQPVSSIGRSAD